MIDPRDGVFWRPKITNFKVATYLCLCCGGLPGLGKVHFVGFADPDFKVPTHPHHGGGGGAYTGS